MCRLRQPLQALRVQLYMMALRLAQRHRPVQSNCPAAVMMLLTAPKVLHKENATTNQIADFHQVIDFRIKYRFNRRIQ